MPSTAFRVILVVGLLPWLMLLPAWPVRAQDGTPSPAIRGAVTVETVLTATYEAAPATPAFIGLARFKLPPGVATSGGGIDGPRMFLVESGAVTFALLEPAAIIREVAGSTPVPESISAEREVVLLSGDALIVQLIPPLEIRNDAAEPASYLDAAVWPGVGGPIRPFTSPDGIIFEPLTVGTADELPTAPITVTLSRITVLPGQMTPLDPQPGPRLMYVESGRFGLAAERGSIVYGAAASANPSSLPGRQRTLRPGSQALLTAGSAVIFQTGAAARVENLGRTKLVLLSLVVRPAQR